MRAKLERVTEVLIFGDMNVCSELCQEVNEMI